MTIINGICYLAPGETITRGKIRRIKTFDSTGLNFGKNGKWSRRADQLRNHGKIKS